MDASLISTLHLVPHWMTRLLEDHKVEVDAANTRGIKLLEKEGRKAVWSMCALMGVDANGVPGQACQLLERYLSAHMRQYTSVAADQEEWDRFKRLLASRIPLLIATCAQLAAKMSCAGFQVNPNLVRSCLLCKGIVYSVSEIVGSEFQVFSTLGYRVPLWTSVEAAQLLALEAGIPTSLMEGIGLVVNMTEYHRDKMNHRVRSIANISPGTNFSKAALRTLHLAAGAVVASARYLGFNGPDPTPRVASLTNAPVCYIKCISDVILADILIDNDEIERHAVKRKRI